MLMQSENIRHLVIERGVELEELISNVLAQILKINDWKNSLSLGSKGGALSRCSTCSAGHVE